MAIEKYGYIFPEGTHPVTIELQAYRNNRTPEEGGLGKFQHLKNSVDLLWNQGTTSRSFIWSPWAEDILSEMCDQVMVSLDRTDGDQEQAYLSVAGCASSGKSDTAAVWALIEFLSGPSDTLVMITSTTLREARRRIWKSVTDLWNALPKASLPGKLVDSMGQIKGLDPNGGWTSGAGLVLVPAEKKKERDAIGKLVGVKQQRLRLVADELPELPESIIHVAFTNLAANPSFQMIGLGNPNSRFDAFGVFSKPEAGWASISEQDVEWETSRGKCLRFDAYKCPNVVERKIIYPWMPTWEKVEQARKDYGENSLLFYRMYRGFWCPTGASTGVYSEADLTQGGAAAPAKWDENPKPVPLVALDPAFAHGGDRCVAMLGRFGHEDGAPVLEFNGFETFKEDLMNRSLPRSHQIARGFKDFCIQRGISPRNAAVDVTGAGGPFADILAMEWSDEFLRVNFSGKASSTPVSATDRTAGFDRYNNRMSEIWFAGQELLRSSQLRNIGDEQAREMVAREYSTTSRGKISVEPKEKYKSRTGQSPDVADAGFILVELARQRHRLLGGERFEVSQTRQETFKGHVIKLDILRNSDRRLL